MLFLVDAQLPPALARWLRDQGYAAHHVFDQGMASASDRAIWRHAQMLGAIIVTKDQDFANWRVTEADGPPIVWLRCGNTRRHDLVAWFGRHLATVIAALERGESVIEVR